MPTILTQFAFDTDPVLDWIEAVRARGIDSTIRIGTPGPAGIKRLLGFARRFGIGANAMIVKKYGFSLTNLMGTAGPDKFVTDLSAMLADTRQRDAPATARPGPVKLHFYTFGGLLATAEWAREFTAAHSPDRLQPDDRAHRSPARPRLPDRPRPRPAGHRRGGHAR